jgi:ketosteroid isomerase-like protein
MTNHDVARAFSAHRFEETLDHLADHVVWNLIGQTRLEGRDAVIAACQGTTAGNANVTTTWLRFISTGDGDVIAVDAIGRYAGPGGVTAVSSCDIYEFTDGTIHTVTSYFAEVNPDFPETARRAED